MKKIVAIGNAVLIHFSWISLLLFSVIGLSAFLISVVLIIIQGILSIVFVMTTQAELAKEISITPSYVNRLIRKNENVVNKTFLAMMEALGYDVTLVYEKREG